MKNKKILLVIVLLLLGIVAFVGYKATIFAMSKYHYLRDKITEVYDYTEKNYKKYNFEYDWVDNNVLVAHAFGGKGTKTYTNSLEAFLYNYELGHRIFEVDMDLTVDKVTICSHDEDYWRYITNNENSDVEYSYEVFKRTPLFTDYTPLDYKDIIDLMNQYPDIYIITDSKYSDEISVYQQFSQIVDYAKSVNPQVLDRLIVQIYNKDMLGYIMNIYDFRSVIFTLYQIAWDAEDIAKFCIKSGVNFITVSEAVADSDIELWKSMRLKVGVHTINEEEVALELIKKNVDIIYTDFIEPNKIVKE